MKCPNCEEILVMTERQGVEIDYCPKCRGVWLDKGELDKIIEKSTATDSNQQLKQQLDRNRHDDDDNDGGFFNKNRGFNNQSNIIKEKEVF
ncbi:MAG: zf-TFIIB domain-containing protein [Chitinophagaceae bacterium]|nr:zf-TFIIB domain-containing protein [Chitinophagaceae bacterium]MBK9485368.1 zf-TFIIB domain-containing protein [Chitinophagaceae bacterium]